MLELIRLAASSGIEIHAAHLGADTFGYWSPDEHRIYFDMHLTPNEVRVTIAHELGHAHHGHRCDGPREEHQAELYAARLLIDPREYARLEAVDPDRHTLADDLGVTVDLIDFYEQHCLTKLHGVTYARARHGIGQFRFKQHTAVAYG